MEIEFGCQMLLAKSYGNSYMKFGSFLESSFDSKPQLSWLLFNFHFNSATSSFSLE